MFAHYSSQAFEHSTDSSHQNYEIAQIEEWEWEKNVKQIKMILYLSYYVNSAHSGHSLKQLEEHSCLLLGKMVTLYFDGRFKHYVIYK